MELALALLLQQPPLLCGSPQNIGTKLKPQETLMKLGCDKARLATDVPIHPNGARWGRGWGSMQVHQVRLHQTPKMNFFMGLFLFVCISLSHLEKTKLHLQTVVILGLAPSKEDCDWLKVIQTSQSWSWGFFFASVSDLSQALC